MGVRGRCTYCGAPIRLNEAKCRYCETLVKVEIGDVPFIPSNYSGGTYSMIGFRRMGS